MNRLETLQNESIYILREAYYKYDHLCMLWSMGKDSTVLLNLVEKAFLGHIPFPVVHIDTGYKLEGMIEYRDNIAKEKKLCLICGKNNEALQSKKTFPDGSLSRLECCGLLKTKTLQDTLSGKGKRYRLNRATGTFEEDKSGVNYTATIVGIRSDEEGSRSKEHVFSIRSQSQYWQPEKQNLEINYNFLPDASSQNQVRIHPLLNWTEIDIWEYIAQEDIPVFPKYFDQGEHYRYRSLGCYPCTRPIESEASNAYEVLYELKSGKLLHTAERAGREQDKEGGNSLEKLRRGGYM